MMKRFDEEFVETLLELCTECINGDTDNCYIRIPLKNKETLVVEISFSMDGEEE